MQGGRGHAVREKERAGRQSQKCAVRALCGVRGKGVRSEAQGCAIAHAACAGQQEEEGKRRHKPAHSTKGALAVYVGRGRLLACRRRRLVPSLPPQLVCAHVCACGGWRPLTRPCVCAHDNVIVNASLFRQRGGSAEWRILKVSDGGSGASTFTFRVCVCPNGCVERGRGAAALAILPRQHVLPHSPSVCACVW